MNQNYYLGIDLGGTKINAALITENGEIYYQINEKTDISGGPKLIKQLLDITNKLVKYENGVKINSIGIGSPGRVDAKNGLILDCTPNIKNWEGTELKKIVESNTNLPTFVDNDGNVAAYGEYCIRKKRKLNYNLFILLTIGTGLGSGIIYNDKIFRGNGHGVEIGHMIIDTMGRPCTCGQLGCLEMYVSGVALEIQANDRIHNYHNSLLKSVAGKISSHDVFNCAKKGDPFALTLIEEFTRGLADGLVNLINIFDPDIIVISGGIVQQKEMFLDKTTDIIAENINYKGFKRSIIQFAETNEKAGLIGAGYLASLGFNRGEI